MAEWWKQLYGESEGKDGKGIFPASVEFTADLHSMGQFIQQGPRTLMESIVRFDKSRCAYPFPFEEANAAGLSQSPLYAQKPRRGYDQRQRP